MSLHGIAFASLLIVGPLLPAGVSDAHAPFASAAQTEDEPAPTEKVLVQRNLSVLKDSGAASEDRANAVDELLTLGALGPSELANYLVAEFESSHKKNGKALDKQAASFDKVAAKLIDKRLNRKAEAAIDEYRGVIMKNTRKEDLTKDEIKASSDKAYDAIAELLTITPDDVWQAKPDMQEDWAALQDAVKEEAILRADWSRAFEALEAAGDEGAKLAERVKAPKSDALTVDAMMQRLERSAEMARPMRKADRKAFEKNARLAADPEAGLLPGELNGIRALNLRLVLIGLPAQTIDPKLCAACRDHSKDMRELEFFSHTSPVDGKTTFAERAANFGTSSNAENIAFGARTGPDSITQWWYSPGHHKNMLKGFGTVGLGQSTTHWTQNFR